MTEARYHELEGDYSEVAPDTQLTQEEIVEGWHFCYEWDGMLVGPGMMEAQICRCFSPAAPWPPRTVVLPD